MTQLKGQNVYLMAQFLIILTVHANYQAQILSFIKFKAANETVADENEIPDTTLNTPNDLSENSSA